MDKIYVPASNSDMYAFILSVCVGHIGEFFFSVIQFHSSGSERVIWYVLQW